jgi:SAM-dependent methyltransferase
MVQPPIDDTPRIGSQQVGDSLGQYLLYRRHRFAYEMASARKPNNGTCLDIGAGLGHGLSILAGVAHKLTALDLSYAALRKLPSLPNVYSVQADATELPFPAGCFDCVVAFQVIEHVLRDDALRAVSEIRRVLRAGGKAFITTPNARWRLLPGQRPRNPHHIHEYTPRDIVRFVEQAAGIGKSNLFGVVGRNGAQEIERARVAPSILAAYGWLPGRALARAWRRLRPKRHGLAYRLTAVEDTEADWFELTSNFAEGLDFFLEFER